MDRFSIRPKLVPSLVLLAGVFTTLTSVGSPPPAVLHDQFQRGLAPPWGTGQFAGGHTTWWNSGLCNSVASVDPRMTRGGRGSLHILNRSARAPNVYGTTQRTLAIEPNRPYRIVVWARAQNLASTGGASIAVDRQWQVRPIQFPRGTYDWAAWTGVFSLPEPEAQLRILSEDTGQLWIDQILILAEPSTTAAFASDDSPQPMAGAPVVVADFDGGLLPPWGTGQYAEGRTAWWNSGHCRSEAVSDPSHKRQGTASLHIVNDAARSPQVYGTTQQPILVQPGLPYRVTLWARAQQLASTGGISIVVDSQWQVRPIALPAGTYDWAQLTGEFSLPESAAQLRILSDDVGEVWIDDLRVEPMATAQLPLAHGSPSPAGTSDAVPPGPADPDEPPSAEGQPAGGARTAGPIRLDDLRGVWQASFLGLDMTLNGSAHHLAPANTSGFRFEINRQDSRHTFHVLDHPGSPRELVAQGDELVGAARKDRRTCI